MSETQQAAGPSSVSRFLRHRDVLAGLLFVAVAIIGLWASRDYPIGTATRMGTGYVPRLLCWILLGIGIVIFTLGLRSGSGMLSPGPPVRRALIFVPASLLVFAFTIGRFGVVVAIVLLVGVGSLAGRDSRVLEVAGVALALIALTLAIFVWGIGLPIPVWPEW